MGLSGGIASRIAITLAILLTIVFGAAGLSFVATSRPATATVEISSVTDQTRSGETRQAAAASEKSSIDSPWEKRWWIDKTARLLRNGHGLGPFDDIERLETLSKEQIAREFMQDARFGDAVLDFNMYFLGFKVDNLKVDGEYIHAAYDFSNAISSAKALLDNGDYLKLFDLVGDYYLAPLTVKPIEEDLSEEDARLPPKQLRQKVVEELYVKLEGLLELREGSNPIGLAEFCGEIDYLLEQRGELQKQLFRAFTDTEIFVLMRGGIPDHVFNMVQKAIQTECEKPANEADITRLDSALWQAALQIDVAFNEIFKFEPARYGPDTVADFRPIDRKAFPVKDKWPVFGFEQGTALANSSTNYNRKRGAYVLKRFFCDDLTPVGFDDPKEHVAGAHGTQTSCYSCHYKLDPMAGFFRNYGALFADASDSPDIVFDDLASVDRQKYLSNWRAPKQSSRDWNVGYIRSPRWTKQNSYGQSLGDLSKIIRQAPEAKRCLMKRLTQYVVGENQTISGSYLDDLTNQFTQDAKSNASVAFKNALIRVLQSEAYQVRNPDPTACYDQAPEAGTGQRPPCRVAYILEKNCVQCHDGNDALNALNLSKWIDAPNGAGKTFEHLSANGTQLPAQKTLAEIAARLSTTDPKYRMPKNKPMSSQERQELFLWTQKALSRIAGG